MPDKSGEIMVQAHFLQIIKIAAHGIPVHFKGQFTGQLDKLFELAVLLKPKWTISAISGNEGRNSLVSEGRLQIIPAGRWNNPIHMGVHINKPRGNHLPCTIDNLTIDL
jgi:hypothetical protein